MRCIQPGQTPLAFSYHKSKSFVEVFRSYVFVVSQSIPKLKFHKSIDHEISWVFVRTFSLRLCFIVFLGFLPICYTWKPHWLCSHALTFHDEPCEKRSTYFSWTQANFHSTNQGGFCEFFQLWIFPNFLNSQAFSLLSISVNFYKHKIFVFCLNFTSQNEYSLLV